MFFDVNMLKRCVLGFFMAVAGVFVSRDAIKKVVMNVAAMVQKRLCDDQH